MTRAAMQSVGMGVVGGALTHLIAWALLSPLAPLITNASVALGVFVAAPIIEELLKVAWLSVFFHIFFKIDNRVILPLASFGSSFGACEAFFKIIEARSTSLSWLTMADASSKLVILSLLHCWLAMTYWDALEGRTGKKEILWTGFRLSVLRHIGINAVIFFGGLTLGFIAYFAWGGRPEEIGQLSAIATASVASVLLIRSIAKRVRPHLGQSRPHTSNEVSSAPPP
jgi:hypothetical protein